MLHGLLATANSRDLSVVCLIQTVAAGSVEGCVYHRPWLGVVTTAGKQSRLLVGNALTVSNCPCTHCHWALVDCSLTLLDPLCRWITEINSVIG